VVPLVVLYGYYGGLCGFVFLDFIQVF